LVNNIVGYSSEVILNENSLQKLSEILQPSMEESTVVAELSKRILSLSSSLDILAKASDNDTQGINQTKHNSFILQRPNNYKKGYPKANKG